VVGSPPHEHAIELEDKFRLTLAGGGSAVILDLEPALGAQIAAQLNECGLAHPVLVLPRWPYSAAILPTDSLVGSLVRESVRLGVHTQCPSVVFVLDAQRSRSLRHRPERDIRADNRYALSAADLPNLATLRRAGITRILKIAQR
jgi:hypothetical protein